MDNVRISKDEIIIVVKSIKIIFIAYSTEIFFKRLFKFTNTVWI